MAHRPKVLDQLDKVEEAVRLFDTHYDARQLYAHVAELFRSVPRFEDADAADLRWQFAYVGAAWAQIVTSVDLTYELGRGYQVHDESLGVAERLIGLGAVHPIDPVFGKQVLVRWNDASAKLYYRTGDHSTARVFWDKCLSLLEDSSGNLIDERLAFIYPDIKSSARRNEYEEIRQTTDDKRETPRGDRPHEKAKASLVSDLSRLIKDTRGYFAAHHSELTAYLDEPDTPTACNSSELLARLTVRDRERLRGLANLYQNSFEPTHVARIAELTGDQLRLMQALHEQARTHYGRLKDQTTLLEVLATYSKASSLWKRVRDADHWRRGRLFARQNLALLERDFLQKLLDINNLGSVARPSHLFSCLRELISLVDDIQSVWNESKGEYAAIGDVDLHGWTVTFAYETLDLLKRWGKLDASEIKELVRLELRVIEELEQMVRDHRQVIRVGVYKQAFAKYYRSHFQRIVRHYYDLKSHDESSLRKLVCWVEESSSRELLDMVATRRRESLRTTSSRFSSQPVRQNGIFVGADDDPIVGKTRLRRLRQADETLKQRILQACIESEREFNEFAKTNPVAAAHISPDIDRKAQAFVDEHQSVIIRFFEVGEGEYGAVVFHPQRRPHATLLPSVLSNDGDGRAKTTTPSVDTALTLMSELLEPTSTVERIEEVLPRVSRAVGDILTAVAPEEVFRPDPSLERTAFNNIIVIPVGKLWKIPLHAAIVGDRLVGTQTPVVYSMSISALVDHGRCSGMTDAVGPGALGVCTSFDTPSPNSEIFGRHVLTKVKPAWGCAVDVRGPTSRQESSFTNRVTRDSLLHLLNGNVAVLYLGCHGEYYADDLERSCLVFHNSTNPDDAGGTVLITPEQLALASVRREIPLVILAACVSGQGVGLPGGEVSGFYRAMAALGAASCMLSFWPVDSVSVDDFAVNVIRSALRDGRSPLASYRHALEEAHATCEGEAISGNTIMKSCCLGMFI